MAFSEQVTFRINGFSGRIKDRSEMASAIGFEMPSGFEAKGFLFGNLTIAMIPWAWSRPNPKAPEIGFGSLGPVGLA